MYLTDEILEKLNGSKKTNAIRTESGTGGEITLPDIMVRSFAEVKELAGDSLTWGEKNFLCRQAQQELKESKMAESRILSRANPQLASAVRLGIRQSGMLGSYNDLFPQRANSFVKPGSVASMFSPAGYLTELYREARNLHADTSQYHLDTRRPDLAALSLSQENMDEELSTLSLSNELLMNNIETQESLDYDGVLEMLATCRQTGSTPYHHPYEATRQSIILQDPEFAAFRRNPDVAKLIDPTSLLGIQADISPGLHEILTEEISEENADDLITKNFGENTNVTVFQNPAFLAHYYGLSNEELALFLEVISGNNFWVGDTLNSFYITGSGQLQTYQITRTAGANYDTQLEYMDLFCAGKNQFYVNVKFKDDYGKASLRYLLPEGGDEYLGQIAEDDQLTHAGVVYRSATFPLTDETLKDKFELFLYRYGPEDGDAKISSCAQFLFNATDAGANQDFDPTNISRVLLLKLNKLIRLYRATGITPSDIRTVIESSNSDLAITSKVLSNLFRVKYYMQRYGSDVSAALVLSGAAISQISHGGQDSVFTRLFNSPSLNNQIFTADGTTIALNPADVTDTFRTGVLRRAFGVSDTELYTLWSLASGKAEAGDFACTIDNISALYRMSLLADVHGLSVTGLAMLLSVSPYAGTAIAGLSNQVLNALISFLGLYTQWLTEQKMAVTDLYLMLTDNYSTDLSPDIENLVTTLKTGLANLDLSGADEAGLIRAVAPFIAAAMQMDSADTAAAILQWADQLKPSDLTVGDFLALADNDAREDEETAQLVSFCQVLGQLAVTVRSLSLTTGELSLAVTQPEKFVADAEALPQNITTVRTLSRFHNWLQRCGVSATEILSALGSGTLTLAHMALAMALDERVVAQGLAQVNSESVTFSSWTDADAALQWVDMAGTLGITPAGVASLVNIDYNDPGKALSYQDWQDISQMMQGGLSAAQTVQLHATLDEALSAAVSAYVIKTIAPSWVTNRDQLYSWLLIDNQVSAQIKTTRIAEAIASVQLYVNRALSGQEEGVVSAVKSKIFFASDWDNYNKRYSTWAGVSQLVYYPENYVDPTLRIGQTGMMNEMLQSLSQSQLTSDTVEAAFKTYMTRFEEIANLDVISGYHDSVSDKSGKTYLIGRSAIGEYYWRSADIAKMSDGRLPANAWSEWKKITAGIAPVTDLVRPVIFQSRLYVVWVESREVATTGSTTTKSVEYLLKYAHILHDGTWSAPVTITQAQNILPPEKVDIADTGMYCAQDAELEKLYIYFYKKADSYSTLPASIVGLSLYPDGTTENIPAASASKTAGYIYLQLDTTSAVRLNTPYTGGSTRISLSGTTSNGGDWGYGYYTYMTGGKLSNVTAELSGDDVVINFNATARIIYNGYAGSRSRTQVEMMKSTGTIGNTFYLPQGVSRSTVATSSGRNFECIFRNYTDAYQVAVLVTDGISPVTGDTIYGFNDSSKDKLNSTTGDSSVYVFEKSLANSKLWLRTQTTLQPENYVYTYMSPYEISGVQFPLSPVELMFSDFKKIDTSIYTENVKLAVGSEKFTSDTRTKFSFDESLCIFNNKSVSVPLNTFSGNTAQVAFTMSANAPTGDLRSLGSEIITITLTRVDESSMPVITLNRTDSYAQYLQYDVYRIRVNTLFAKQLVARANTGLNAVLSMDTQHLQEPKLGKGFYVDLSLPVYDVTTHGSSRNFTLNLKHVVDNNAHVVYSGMLADSEISVRLFVPLDEKPLDSACCARVFLKTSKTGDSPWKGPHFQYTDSTQSAIEINSSSDISMFTNVTILPDTTESMDFSGANAIYFWEMFYYVPMMVFKRLLSEGKFTEATQWIKYVWSPDGYLINGEAAPYQWNVRPLQEETTWHANPLDSVDADSVAQADPMHYKVATFMAWIDLLIARGDAAYRQLERDTLNEAKMWYVQALDVLGHEPYLNQNAGWAAPRLTDAADKTTTKSVQQALLDMRQQVVSGELRTANSLTDLFLPQQNEKLAGYWQTLVQRLYNLRHNLSIDGNPLSQPVYAAPADPAALLSAAVNASSGGSALPTAVMPAYRFPVILESARGMVGQLSQFGSTLLSITERQDAEALSELLQTQGSELVLQSIALQDKSIAEIDADRAALEASLSGAQSRLDSYTSLYEENINTGEKQAIDLYLSSSVISASATALHMAGAALEMMPNIYGMAVGGSRYGALLNAGAIGMQIGGDASRIAADRLSQSEAYRRRRQEWEIQRNSAESDMKQINAQLDALAVRREGAVLQKTYMETQQSQTQAQMAFLQNKFSSKALYNWLRGKLAAIYYQFYDLTVSRCLMAQEAYKYKWALGDSASFIRPGAWQGTYAGLMAGETLMLNLAQMEQSYLQKDEREKEVTRTVCLSEVYATQLKDKNTTLADVITSVVDGKTSDFGSAGNGLKRENGQLQATLTLSHLEIGKDYPDSLGKTKRIKQISVTLPALVGPYQDVRAVLSYGDPKGLAKGCDALAVSHGMNDGGQFQLDFNDGRWLPFEGIPVDSSGVFTLSFPGADDKQKTLLQTLTDIILHIRYTIVS